MLVDSPNKAIDTANDRNDVDEKEMIMPTAVAETAKASARSPYLDILLTTNRRVAKRDIPKKKNNSSIS
jgi:hypothetical protein